ncbi:DENN domain-containing protein 1B [Bagarius yarrelli]|uniref:DENN domain-containing protein 1B n=1 Tax=Bagarius yarrelli TaxID=175774 RepID=A0A556V670_BAGYA|nr:DENN domain-containing protein 1B [Bagarius yarrelli]
MLIFVFVFLCHDNLFLVSCSYLPWFEIYYKLLNTLADYLTKHQEADLNDLLEKLYSLTVPNPNTAVALSLHLHFVAPDTTGLPTIPENRNLTEYFVAVDVNNMLHLYANMLHERRIIITSSKLSTSVKNRSLEDVTILNVDTNTLETPADDLRNLPTDVVSGLKSKLKKQSTATGSGVARAFLRSQAALFGSYRDALRYKPGEPITFCEQSFVAHRSSAMRSFLEMAVNLQLFKQFIDGRLVKLNEGKGFTDVFEEEITEGGFCKSNSRSYQQWMRTVKAKVHAKKGLRGVKDRIRFKDTEEEEEEDGLYCRGSPSSTKSLSPRRLQKRGVVISCGDTGEVLYIEERDGEFSLDVGQTGQMNLLEEILDSLSTTMLDHNTKLSSAKSLDFFRSMDKIDCCTTNLSSAKTCPVQASEVDMTAGGDQHSWNIKQHDGGINGKHLPPSLRRQFSTCSLPAFSTKPCETLSDVRNSFMMPPTQPVALDMDENASPSVSPERPSDFKLIPESQVTKGCSGLRRKTVSKETLRHYQERSQQDVGNRDPVLLIPWEINKKDDGKDIVVMVQEKDLLEQIEFHLSAAVNSNL